QSSHRTGNSVSALDVSSARVAPSIEPTPSPTPAPGAPVLPYTANANPPSATRTTPAATVHPTSKATSKPTKPTNTPVSDQAPVVILYVTPEGAPLTVFADASQSNDNDGTGIANFVFNFGDDTIIT